MGHRISYDGDDLEIRDGGDELIWDNDRRPIQLLDEDAWITISDLEISFPDFTKANAHLYTSQVVFPDPEVRVNYCAGYIAIHPQEWGPSESSPFTLADETLATVPSGVNYLDVRVTLTRTKTPTAYHGIPIPNNMPTDETFLPGGSMDLELSPLWVRTAWIGLSGTNVILRRWQSSGTNGVIPTFDSSGVSGDDYGWSASSGYGNARLAAKISQNNVANSDIKSRASGVCSLTDTTDFGAIWSGSAIIRPGYVKV